MEHEDNILELIAGYLRGSLAPEDYARLLAWVDLSEENKAFFQRCCQPGVIDDSLNEWLNMDEEAIDKRIAKVVNHDPTARAYRRARFSNIAAYVAGIAGCLLVIGVTIGFFSTGRNTGPDQAGDSHRMSAAACRMVQSEMLFSRNMPRGKVLQTPTQHVSLTTADGSKIAIDSLPIGRSIDRDGWKIARTGPTEISYTLLPIEEVSNTYPGYDYHILSMPPGQSWTILLPDGSGVRLGAASSLSFMINNSPLAPVPHLATLQGEAFFDIAARSDQPFMVLTEKIRVTGTGSRFDIKDYAADKEATATLLSGSIRVHRRKNVVGLRPGQQYLVDTSFSGLGTVSSVDTAALSWQRPG